MFLLRVIYRLVYISYVSFVLLSKKINTGVIFLYLCPSVYKTSSGEVFLHLLSLCLKKNILSSSNPLGLQPLPLYFLCVKHRGRKGYHARGFYREVKIRAEHGFRGVRYPLT